MNIDLHRVLAFHAVATTGGFTKAAKKLHVTQPTVSVQIKKLEEQLGVRLFDRLPRKVVLTRAGEILFEQAEKLQGILTDIERSFDDLSSLKRGRLSLAVHQSTAMHFLPTSLEAYTERHPLVDVSIRTETTRGIRDAVLEGDVELGMVFVPPESKLLDSRRVLRWERVLVVPEDHPLAEGPLRLERIVEHPFISYAEGTETQKLIDRPFEALEDGLSIRLYLGSTDLILRYVALGHGISIVHDMAFLSGDHLGIVRRSMARYYPPGHLYLLWRKDSPLSAAAKAYTALLETVG